MINYNNRQFRLVNNSENGETSGETVFYYKQEGRIVSADYAGGKIQKGYLLGLVGEDGCILFCYQQINIYNKLMTGTCTSRPEQLPNGKIRLHERWQWTSGDCSSGSSIVGEI